MKNLFSLLFMLLLFSGTKQAKAQYAYCHPIVTCNTFYITNELPCDFEAFWGYKTQCGNFLVPTPGTGSPLPNLIKAATMAGPQRDTLWGHELQFMDCPCQCPWWFYLQEPGTGTSIFQTSISTTSGIGGGVLTTPFYCNGAQICIEIHVLPLPIQNEWEVRIFACP